MLLELSESLKENYEIIAKLAIGLPALALITFLSIYKFRFWVRPKVIKVANPIYLVGYQVETTTDNFEKDEAALWDKYKERRATIENRKEAYSNLSIKKKLDNGKWLYSIGTIVNDYSQVPSDLMKFHVPTGLYAYSRFKANDPETRKKKKAITEKFVAEKWLPESGYEFDYSTDAFEMEYHDKRDASNTRITILYFAVRPKTEDVTEEAK